MENIRGVRVAILDVGSNSMRLLVAGVERGNVKELARERVYLRLGDDAYRLGRISVEKLEQTGEVAERFARVARKAAAERLETIVTAPGRQAENGDELADVLAKATRAPVVVLDAEEEGRLAWHGAVSRMSDPPDSVAVVDLGGGSCEIAVGSPAKGPTWVQSRDAGALRVTRAFLPGHRLSKRDARSAGEQVEHLLEGLAPPCPDATLAVGGTARAVGRLVGRRFGEDDLAKLAKALVRKGPQAVVAGTGITRDRAETLLGGTLVLAEVTRLLGTKLEVGRGGLREGAALALAHEAAAVA
jgi:exopolyphosphatase / guanosine-5'-triphosphate,3'-diphosphate pyrophosphatase